MRNRVPIRLRRTGSLLVVLTTVLIVLNQGYAQESGKKGSSYAPVVIKEDFATIVGRMKAAKPGVMKRQMDLLNERYDLSDHPAKEAKMSRGKPIQEGVRVKLPKDMSWEKLSAMSPEEIREKDLFPAGFLPLPHPNHRKAAWSSPSSI